MTETITSERLTLGFAPLFTLAVEVLNGHTNNRGLCAVCGCAFPCRQAVLAEHNLAL